MSTYQTAHEVIVSPSGTRHIVGVPAPFQKVELHAFRIPTLCDFGINPDDCLPQPAGIRDCPFCLAAAAEAAAETITAPIELLPSPDRTHAAWLQCGPSCAEGAVERSFGG
jgi:hypothetical protein